MVGNYVIGEHVPVQIILRILREKPAIAEIAVSGMPIGSPGIEDSNPQPYTVNTFEEEGKKQVDARLEP